MLICGFCSLRRDHHPVLYYTSRRQAKGTATVHVRRGVRAKAQAAPRALRAVAASDGDGQPQPACTFSKDYSIHPLALLSKAQSKQCSC